MALHQRWILAASVLFVLPGLTACDSPHPFPGEHFHKAENEARQRYQEQYDELSALDLEIILQRLAEARGSSWTPRPEGKASLLEAALPSQFDPVLARLVADPELMAVLDLERPRQFAPGVDPRDLIGRYRCWDNDALRTSVLGIMVSTVPGPKLPCATLADAYVIREGSATSQGGWLLLLPAIEDCAWLYLVVNGDSLCATSLKTWLAASVVGAQSRWDRFENGEMELVEEMRRQPQLSLSEGVKELIDLPKPGEQGSRGGWNSLRFNKHAPEGPLATPLGDYSDAIRQLGTLRPGAMLLPNETYLLPMRRGVSLIRLWNGSTFTRLRLDSHDWEQAVVVIHPQPGRPHLVQIPGTTGAIYVDNQDRAFLRFKDWVDYSRAQIRIWRRETDQRGYRAILPNAAPPPVG